MKKKHSEENLVWILNEVTAGARFWKPAESTASARLTYYNRKAKYAGMGVSDIQRLKELESGIKS